MNAREIIKCLNEYGGLDTRFIASIARKEKISERKYIKEYVKESFNCSDYVANKVADYFL